MPDDIPTLFLTTSAKYLADSARTLSQCLDRLSDDQVWSRGGPHENAIGNLVLHLSGNIRQWILHGVGSQPDVRTRDAEFSTAGGCTRAELLALFQATVDEAAAVLRSTPAPRLVETIRPQGRDVSVFEAIYKSVTHLHTHIGQIVFATKQLAARDLDLTIPRPR